MIDRRRAEVGGARPDGEEKQREGVRAAGHR
jgi:hypothetical protein